MVLSPAKVRSSERKPFSWLISGRWSFGGNRQQIKAETRLMADVNLALRANAEVDSSHDGNLQALGLKEELLHTLLESEQMRLVVWLYPLDHERRHIFSSHSARAWPDVSNTMILPSMNTDLV